MKNLILNVGAVLFTSSLLLTTSAFASEYRHCVCTPKSEVHSVLTLIYTSGGDFKTEIINEFTGWNAQERCEMAAKSLPQCFVLPY